MPSLRSRAVVAASVFSVALALGACRDTGKGALYEVSGRLFEFNYRLARATYVVTLNPLRPVDEGNVAVVDFENPAGGPPLVVEQKIWPKLPHVTLTSPPLTCVVKDRPYAVAIHIKDRNGAVLQELKTTLVSTQDQSDLPDAPLVLGTVYTLNPALAGHPDGRLPGNPKPDCPK
ncbi:MAG: hypothetical protein J0I98_02760 [Mesorhizobium sp.]|nr:hypothetical protein [Mesorhizobium sp.]MBN9241695.1 hypothetical protein [Mesorhizobium sp.]